MQVLGPYRRAYEPTRHLRDTIAGSIGKTLFSSLWGEGLDTHEYKPKTNHGVSPPLCAHLQPPPRFSHPPLAATSCVLHLFETCGGSGAGSEIQYKPYRRTLETAGCARRPVAMRVVLAGRRFSS
jgi:hypothetical protein